MRKLLSFILVAILLCTVSVGCTNISSENINESSLYKSDEAPSITVKYNNDKVIDYHVALNEWNGTAYKREDTIIYIIENSDYDSLPYLEEGTIINIEFAKRPDNIIIKNTLVNKEGQLRYDDKVASVDIEVEQKKSISFTVEPHMATFLSSNTDDYKAKSAIHGIKIICQFGINECEYAFVYRSDPISIFDEEVAKENDEQLEEIQPAGNLYTAGDGKPSEEMEQNASVIVMVSNQSFNVPKVYMSGTVDGLQIFDGKYDVEMQHNFLYYYIYASPGEHILRITANEIAIEETIIIIENEKQWVSFMYINSKNENEQIHVHKQNSRILIA